MPDVEEIETSKAKELIEKGDVTILDIRDDGAYQQAHIQGAVQLNDNNIDEFLTKADKEKTVICYCYKGFSSQGATQYLKENGFKKVYSMTGGFEKWRTEFPSVSGNN